MKDEGKKNLLGVLVDAVDYEAAVARVAAAADEPRAFAATALAVHGVMEGVRSDTYRYRLNHLDLVTPDGQPVRWFVNLLHRTGLPDRVYGPTLMARLCERAAAASWPLYLYGTTNETLDALAANLRARWPGLEIAGTEPSKFGRVGLDEQLAIAERIGASGARLCFVGLGCPRQEIFVHHFRDLVACPLVAVGAAFDFFAGTAQEPPELVQRAGLQWLHRLLQEPRRLWRRYLLLNPWFLTLAVLQLARVHRPPASGAEPSDPLVPA